MRPVILATRGTATYTMARKLAYILRPLITSSVRNVKNTKDLVESMEGVSLNEDETLVSFDVKSLFTSIPVEEAIKICEQRLKEDDTLSDRTTMDVDTIICLLRFLSV